MPKSSMIIKHYEGFGGNFIDSQYLGAAYETGKPHMLENTLTKIFSSKSRFFDNKLLTQLIGKSVTTTEIDTEIFRWRLQGAEDKDAYVVENLESSNPAPCLNNSTIRIKLDLDYFAYPDVLMGEDNEFPLQVMEAMPDGQGTIYVLRLVGDDPTASLPISMLEPGKRFSKVWTSVPSEYNQWFGTQQYPEHFMLESQIGAFAQRYSVTDKALRDQGRLSFDFIVTDMNGKENKVTTFLPMAEAKMWDELWKSIEAQSVYGKKETVPGETLPLFIVI